MSLLKKNLLSAGMIFVYMVLFSVCFRYDTSAQTSPDAIALRVLPNPENISARRWYEERGFTGSPQAIKIDGYAAVRDGRTVYVNTANIDTKGTAAVADDEMFTNIYIISYNQEAEKATTDIFGQILKRWKFNSNLDEPDRCLKANESICLTDEECPVGDFCQSRKAKVIRDTRRLEDFADFTSILGVYFEEKGRYPTLSSGTYLPNKTLSVWPSWQQTLSSALGKNLPLDPINRLGGCFGYNDVTCWDENTKTFVTDLPILPGYSFVYQYNAGSDGLSYSLCGQFESGLVSKYSSCLMSCNDFDGDGYGSPASSACYYTLPDCDDFDAEVHPGAAENCANSKNDDCENGIDCADSECSSLLVCQVACADNTCNGICGPGCTAAQDPDCGCNDNTPDCCPAGCGLVDPDCGAVCTLGPCDTICNSPLCTIAEDPDCGCGLDSANCCGLGCTDATDGNCDPTCADADGDGYGTNGSPLCLHYPEFDCDDRPAGADGSMGTPDDGANIHPNAAEICDGVDNDCNPSTTEEDVCDQDHDDYCDCLAPKAFGSDLGAVCINTNTDNAGLWNSTCDCRDDNSAIHPGVAEICSNGNQDDDCDGFPDCSDPSCSADPMCAACNDTDGDGYDTCDASHPNDTDGRPADCDDGNGNRYPGRTEICGNGIDENCNGMGDDPCLCDDTDGDGYGVCPNCDILNGCTRNGDDCAPADPAINPGATEICDDIDNDCDSNIDEGCDDDGDDYCDRTMQKVGTPAVCPNTPSAGTTGDDCDDNEFNYKPGASENTDFLCTNSIDANCNNLAGCLNEPQCAVAPGCVAAICTDDDGDQHIRENHPVGTCASVCGPGKNQSCIGYNDCDDTRNYIYQGATENCDGHDNDCDSMIDEGCDDDNDNWCDSAYIIYNAPVSVCPNTSVIDGSNGDDCNDDPATCGINCRPAGVSENTNALCADTYDNDCDGDTDCDDSECSATTPCAACCTFGSSVFPCNLCP